MPSFDTYECANCGREFAAHSSAKAASTRYCSPRCHSEDAGL